MNGKPKKKQVESDERNPSTLTQLQYCESDHQLVAATLDQNLLFFSMDNFKMEKQV